MNREKIRSSIAEIFEGYSQLIIPTKSKFKKPLLKGKSPKYEGLYSKKFLKSADIFQRCIYVIRNIINKRRIDRKSYMKDIIKKKHTMKTIKVSERIPKLKKVKKVKNKKRVTRVTRVTRGGISTLRTLRTLRTLQNIKIKSDNNAKDKLQLKVIFQFTPHKYSSKNEKDTLYYNSFNNKIKLKFTDDYTYYTNALTYLNYTADSLFIKLFYDFLANFIICALYNNEINLKKQRKLTKMATIKEEQHAKAQKRLHRRPRMKGGLYSGSWPLYTGPIQNVGPVISEPDMNASWVLKQYNLIKTILLNGVDESAGNEIIKTFAKILRGDTFKDFVIAGRGANTTQALHLTSVQFNPPISWDVFAEDKGTVFIGKYFLKPPAELAARMKEFTILDIIPSGIGSKIKQIQLLDRLRILPSINGVIDSASNGMSETNSPNNQMTHRDKFMIQLEKVVNPCYEFYKNYFPVLNDMSIKLSLEPNLPTSLETLEVRIYYTNTVQGNNWSAQPAHIMKFGSSGDTTIASIKMRLKYDNGNHMFTKYLLSQIYNGNQYITNEEAKLIILNWNIFMKGVADQMHVFLAKWADSVLVGKTDAEIKGIKLSAFGHDNTTNSTIVATGDRGVATTAYLFRTNLLIGVGSRSCDKNDKVLWHYDDTYSGSFVKVLQSRFNHCIDYNIIAGNDNDAKAEFIKELKDEEANELLEGLTEDAGADAGEADDSASKKKAKIDKNANLTHFICYYQTRQDEYDLYLVIINTDSDNFKSGSLKAERLFFIKTINYDIFKELDKIGDDEKNIIAEHIRSIYTNVQIELQSDKFVAMYKNLQIQSSKLNTEITLCTTNINKLIRKFLAEDIGIMNPKHISYERGFIKLYSGLSYTLNESMGKLTHIKDVLDTWKNTINTDILTRKNSIAQHINFVSGIFYADGSDTIGFKQSTLNACYHSLEICEEIEKEFENYNRQQRAVTENVLGTREAFNLRTDVGEAGEAGEADGSYAKQLLLQTIAEQTAQIPKMAKKASMFIREKKIAAFQKKMKALQEAKPPDNATKKAQNVYNKSIKQIEKIISSIEKEDIAAPGFDTEETMMDLNGNIVNTGVATDLRRMHRAEGFAFALERRGSQDTNESKDRVRKVAKRTHDQLIMQDPQSSLTIQNMPIISPIFAQAVSCAAERFTEQQIFSRDSGSAHHQDSFLSEVDDLLIESSIASISRRTAFCIDDEQQLDFLESSFFTKDMIELGTIDEMEEVYDMEDVEIGEMGGGRKKVLKDMKYMKTKDKYKLRVEEYKNKQLSDYFIKKIKTHINDKEINIYKLGLTKIKIILKEIYNIVK